MHTMKVRLGAATLIGTVVLVIRNHRAARWVETLLRPALFELRAARSRLRIALMRRLRGTPAPTYFIGSTNHRRWLQPTLERCGWRAGELADTTFAWQLTKRALPREVAPIFNGLPNLLLLDDKAALALLTRRFTRTQPLVTDVLYGEWDDARVGALRERWSDPACDEPRWWIIKDAHASNGFSAALFDRSARPLVKKDVPGGYCYVVQEYVERPMLIDGRKFEMRQYMLCRGDGSAYTYDGALLRLACVPYDASSRDRRVHITNKFVQTGWESHSEEGRTLDDIERLFAAWGLRHLPSHRSPPSTHDLSLTTHLTTYHSPLTTCRSPLTILRSSLTTHHVPHQCARLATVHSPPSRGHLPAGR